jgi:hypothetical protein
MNQQQYRAMILSPGCTIGAAELTGLLSKQEIEILGSLCAERGLEVRAFKVDRDGRAF